MKVAIYSPTKIPPDNYGGTERVIWWLIKGLHELGVEVYLMAPQGSYHPFAKEVIFTDPPEGDPSLTPVYLDHIIPADVHVLHIHHLSILKYSIPVVKTFHGIPKPCVRYLVDEFTCFLSQSHRVVSGFPRNPFVYNGLDPSEFHFSKSKDNYLLFLSKLDRPEKGLGLAIEVAKKAGVKLVIAGNYTNENFYRDFLKPRLSKNITYVGPVKGEIKKELLSKARALIFPTLWPEPFGLVAIEAMVSGTPVVTTYMGAMPEVVVHGKTGFLCGSFEDMVNAIGMVDDIDPDVCRSWVLSRFTHRRMASGYFRIYRKLTKSDKSI